MASIEITRTELVIRMRGWNALFAMRGSLRVPLSHILAVRARPREAYFDDVIVESWRGVGTYVRRAIDAHGPRLKLSVAAPTTKSN
jgi:hypothetical protein